MLILVANLGSTSFKFKVLDSTANYQAVARGGYERIGQPGGDFPSHAAVIDKIAAELPKLDAIGFKAVHGGPISGAVRVTPQVINTLQEFADVAPAHNPPYIAAMNAFAGRLPDVPQVAAFETAFHQTIPLARQLFGVPYEWFEKHGIRRYGFHGASHRFIAWRSKELVPSARKLVSCHLGGSCSVSGIVDQKSVYNSFGMTIQTGVMHNNRVGDFDTFATLKLTAAGMSQSQICTALSKQSGLLGLSGVSNDLRDIEQAANSGNARAKLAIDAFAEDVRRHVGAAVMACGGVDLLVFTGGIGENSTLVRSLVCNDLQFLKLHLDSQLNLTRSSETRISTLNSPGQIWIIPANEELVVAKLTSDVLTQ